MYLDKYGSEGMTDAERSALADELVERVMYDVPEEYHIDTAEFCRF